MALGIGRVNSGNLVLFTEQLAAMISAQLPLFQVLVNLATETLDKTLKKVLNEAVSRLEYGQDFAEVLEDYPETFDAIYVSMVKAGMNSGKLDSTLEHLAKYIKQVHETKGKVLASLSYPLFLIGALVVLIFVMTKFILPNFKKMYEDFGGKLPHATQVLLKIIAFFEKWGILIFFVVLSCYGVWFLYVNTVQGRINWDRFKLDMPIIGSLSFRVVLSQLLHTMAVLMKSEVPIVTTLTIAAAASGNKYVEELILQASEEVNRGRSLAEAFSNCNIFPGIVIQMISSGEEGGTLERLLASAANYYDKQVEIRLRTIVSLINPALTVIIGLAIAGIMVALFSPVFGIANLTNRGG
ncbi:type II secretion system F family protein [Candidatus Magnetomonas plexicatena]|uniref:type II secretion system F family protein n=1 Tax=Candidatus Magnetomonas plexicatena TaxID=2552947 RepID=UPI001C747AF6|nr:type II secretion system F family protein [Nitrospirales bacterium LBB_01]